MKNQKSQSFLGGFWSSKLQEPDKSFTKRIGTLTQTKPKIHGGLQIRSNRPVLIGLKFWNFFLHRSEGGRQFSYIFLLHRCFAQNARKNFIPWSWTTKRHLICFEKPIQSSRLSSLRLQELSSSNLFLIVFFALDFKTQYTPLQENLEYCSGYHNCAVQGVLCPIKEEFLLFLFGRIPLQY